MAPTRRPIALLVSTTPNARGIREHMGAPAYSYYFVVEALAPVLETFGAWRLIDHPESRLAFAAAKAEAEGFRPVHLAINPLQDVYLSPALPNIVFPFWEFPQIPSRDFGRDTRQNWLRICRPAAMVLTACRFTAEAFRRAGVACPVAVVPIPVNPGAFSLPAWDRSHTWTLTCRHEVLGPDEPEPGSGRPETAADEPEPEGPPRTLAERAWRTARGGFRRVQPWLNAETVGKLVMMKRRLARARGTSPGKLAFMMARDGYRRHVRRWLSDEALLKISETKKAALALIGREPTVVPDPPLPSRALTLGGGLSYLTFFNLGDRRKNWANLLTAFLVAFHDRPDVTLVIKLVTNRFDEHHGMGLLRARYKALGISHRCRVVVVTEFLSEEQLDDLYRVTTCYANASYAEGACLPLMRSLAGGRPAIAPDHTAMADYMDDEVGFVPRSYPEPTYWPHDPDQRLETYRYRPVWSDLRDAFLDSARVAEHEPGRYASMACAARSRMAGYASREAAANALREALDQLPDGPIGAFGWAS
jgi:glycosyltransferase involved in cell wall biosynthesis